MKIAVMNLSGNVGKSTVAKHLLLPRVPGATLVAIETINADEGGGAQFKGKEFGQVLEELMLVDAAVVDIGASNVEAVLKRMDQYAGSHEDFDLFVIPVTPETKQVRDTINTVEALHALGVGASRIRVVFNKVEEGEDVVAAFAPLFAYAAKTKACSLDHRAVIFQSELYQMLASVEKSVGELANDNTDWKAELRQCTDTEERQRAARMLSMKRLAGSAQRNLDEAFALVVG